MKSVRNTTRPLIYTHLFKLLNPLLELTHRFLRIQLTQFDAVQFLLQFPDFCILLKRLKARRTRRAAHLLQKDARQLSTMQSPQSIDQSNDKFNYARKLKLSTKQSTNWRTNKPRLTSCSILMTLFAVTNFSRASWLSLRANSKCFRLW